jgi:uncharacterized membrane protein YdcZ (DUF606 family)
MNADDIKATWKKLITPFVIGLVVFILAILFHNFGSKRPLPQTLSLFGGVFGLVFIVSSVTKMIKFNKYLKSL